MKNLNLIIIFISLSSTVISCQSKAETKQKTNTNNYTIQNYKLDDDEIERRKIADSLAEETNLKENKTDTILQKK